VSSSAPVAPRALLLDALGTLVRLAPPAPALRDELRRRFGVAVSPAQAEHAVAAEIAYYRRHLNQARDETSLSALRRRCAEVLRAALPSDDDVAAIDPGQLTEALLAALRFSAFPDAPPALAAARSRGLRLVVASNWDVSLPEVLGRVGLLDHLDGVVTSAEVGASKPDPRVFVEALRRAGVAPDEAVHVGDDQRADVEGARAAGVRALLLSRDRRPGPPGVPTIASLAELNRALALT
jgi:putative hydrolase of the HAD superfamily